MRILLVILVLICSGCCADYRVYDDPLSDISVMLHDITGLKYKDTFISQRIENNAWKEGHTPGMLPKTKRWRVP